MKVIYVAGPYRAKDGKSVLDNILNAKSVARKLWTKGWSVICPHANTAFMDGPDMGHDIFILGDLELVNRSDAMIMLTGWEQSEGAQMEYSRAVELGMPIYLTIEEVPDAKD